MKLTCITTTFNEGDALFTSVNSILNQSYENFEYLIVDDGSVDDTPELLASLTDPRVKVLRQANDGLSSARNRALEHVSGEYVCFLDADDCRPNWSFQTIADSIQQHDPDVLLCSGILSEVRGELTPFYDTKRFDLLADYCPDGAVSKDQAASAWAWPLMQLVEPQSANKVVRTDLLKTRGIGFPNGHYFEDIYFHTNVLAAANRLAFLRTPSFTYFRRYSRAQITGTAGDKRFDILAVAKLTLESFSRHPRFHDQLYRTCVILSCCKLMEWCEQSITHHHRASFRQAAQGMVKLIDPLYLNLPDHIPVELHDLHRPLSYLKGLASAA